MLAEHLGQPLTRVPDPFGTHDSFGAHNNARLRRFLDTFGFDYEFRSATECYTRGPLRRDAAARAGALRRGDGDHAAVAARRALGRATRRSCRSTRSPATSCRCRSTRCEAGSRHHRVARPGTGERYETPVTGGHAKLQWKPDWAMRWVALGVDYEMAGKDLIDSVKLSGQDRPRARRRAAGGLQLRALPRREGPEDLEVEGQRPDHRRVARPTARRKAWPCSCTTSRARPSACTST